MALDEADKQWIDTAITERTNSIASRLEELLLNFSQSLEREMHEGFAAMATRFDTQAVRLDRHAGYWQTGRRWSGRMDQWAEGIDAALETKDREISELRERISRLEKGRDNGHS